MGYMRNGLHAFIPNLQKIFEEANPRRRAALAHRFFHKIYNIAGLLIINDILDIMGYVAYKPHAFSWFMWFINHNLHIKRRGDFGTF